MFAYVKNASGRVERIPRGMLWGRTNNGWVEVDENGNVRNPVGCDVAVDAATDDGGAKPSGRAARGRRAKDPQATS